VGTITLLARIPCPVVSHFVFCGTHRQTHEIESHTAMKLVHGITKDECSVSQIVLMPVLHQACDTGDVGIYRPMHSCTLCSSLNTSGPVGNICGLMTHVTHLIESDIALVQQFSTKSLYLHNRVEHQLIQVSIICDNPGDGLDSLPILQDNLSTVTRCCTHMLRGHALGYTVWGCIPFLEIPYFFPRTL